MRKEEFERRASDMKMRALAQQNRQSEGPSGTPARNLRRSGAQDDSPKAGLSPEIEVQALRERVKDLESENLRLRQQLAAIANRTPPSSQSSTDSIREQRHNFFKYSNVRRY